MNIFIDIQDLFSIQDLKQLLHNIKNDIWLDTKGCPSTQGKSQAKYKRMLKKHSKKRENDSININETHCLLLSVLKAKNISPESIQIRRCLTTDDVWNEGHRKGALWYNLDFLLGIIFINEQWPLGIINFFNLVYDRSIPYWWNMNLERIEISRQSRLGIENGLLRIVKNIQRQQDREFFETNSEEF